MRSACATRMRLPEKKAPRVPAGRRKVLSLPVERFKTLAAVEAEEEDSCRRLNKN